MRRNGHVHETVMGRRVVRRSPPAFPTTDDDLDESLAQTMAMAKDAMDRVAKKDEKSGADTALDIEAIGSTAKKAKTERAAKKTAEGWGDYL